MGDDEMKKMGKGEAAAAEPPTYEELTAGLPPRSLWQGGAGSRRVDLAWLQRLNLKCDDETL
jgi:hypothetical protein